LVISAEKKNGGKKKVRTELGCWKAKGLPKANEICPSSTWI